MSVVAAALDPFSLWLGILVGGAVAILLAATPRVRERDGGTSFMEVFGVWCGFVGPVIVGVVAGVVWLVQ